MFSKFATRREFLNCGKLSLLFFLNSCSNLPNKIKITLQKSFIQNLLKIRFQKIGSRKKLILKIFGYKKIETQVSILTLL